MTGLRQLMIVAHGYCAGHGIKLSTASARAFGDSKKLAAIEDGADITTRRLANALQFYSDDWPEDCAWPSDVPRPPRTGSPPATEGPAEGSGVEAVSTPETASTSPSRERPRIE